MISQTNYNNVICLQILLFDIKIDLVRGIDPVIGPNPYAPPNTPEAIFKVYETGSYVIVETEVRRVGYKARNYKDFFLFNYQSNV